MVLAIAIFCGVILCPMPAKAALVIIAIEAVVDDVQDPYNYLAGLVIVGTTITGTYTYDTDTPDSSQFPNAGRYEHYAPPSGFSLIVGGFSFVTDPMDTYFDVRILNDYLNDDFYWLTSYNNLPLPEGTTINNINWLLGDPSEAAISSIELPMTAPVLDDWQVNHLSIGGGPEREGFTFSGHVTSAFVIPEPATLLLLGFGTLGFLRRT